MAQTSRTTPPRSVKPTARPAATRPNGRPAPTRVVSSPETLEAPIAQGFCGIMPISAVVHGPPSVGKSALLANLPKPGFLINKKDRGIQDLIAARQVPEPVYITEVNALSHAKPGWDELLARIYEAAGGDQGIENLVLDSMTFFQTMAFRHHCNQDYEGVWGKEGYFAYQTGPKECAQTIWTDLLDALEMVKDAGINTWMVCHTRVKNYSNPTGPSYDRFVPYLDAEVWSQTFAQAQLVLFYNFEAEVTPSRSSKGERGKVKRGTQTRMLYTVRSEAYDAKNRWGMSTAIDAGNSGEEAYNNLCDDFMRCFQ